MRRVSVGIASALLLASCTRTPETPVIVVHAAIRAVPSTLSLMLGAGMAFRPSALLGTYIASYLGQGTSLSRSAIVGAQQQIALFFERTAQENESYQILQDIGSALSVNIQDMLNRSTNRARDLDGYVDALRTLAAAAQRQHEALDSQLDTANETLREKRRHHSDLQRELTKSIRDKDYVTAGGLQDGVNDAQTEVAIAEADVKELRNIIALYDDVLELAEIRTSAIVANRDVLIAGVKVVDVPGIADIGVVQGNPERLRNRPTNGGTFGGL
jgi:hypothetical protein